MNLSFDIDKKLLSEYLISQKLMSPADQVLQLTKPGEGNMNFVVRVITAETTFILKQANPFVQKYPQIAAPVDRVLVESQFYQTIQHLPASTQFVPSLLGLDPFNHIIAIEDLGEGIDFTFLYQRGKSLSGDHLNHLLNFLDLLHYGIPYDLLKAFPDNMKLRYLNHEHLFIYPFQIENGFDLNTITPGLQEISMVYKKDPELRKKLTDLGKIYLSETGQALLHGDYYPGSWLKTSDGIKVIDPEFSYVGKREFDLGILIAHLKMIQAPQHQIENVIAHFKGKPLDWDLTYQFAGVEILRRIIGLAQLPLHLTLTEKEALLKEATHFVKMK